VAMMFSVWTRLTAWFNIGKSSHVNVEQNETVLANDGVQKNGRVGEHDLQIVPLPFYDEALLDRSFTQWKFGDWASLVQLKREDFEGHPEREKLAVLVAAGHYQVGSVETGKSYATLALDWGCSKRLVAQILIAGVHNSLGHAALLVDQKERANTHFKQSISFGAPKSESTLFVDARIHEQTRQIDSSANS
jgi:hypothetical protein